MNNNTLLPLVPRSTKDASLDISNVVREVFQNTSSKFPKNVAENVEKSNLDNAALKASSARVLKTYDETKLSTEDIEIVEKSLMLRKGIYLNEQDIINKSIAATEEIKLTRVGVFYNVQETEVKRYGLLQRRDLLPSKPECSMDFRINSNRHLCLKCPSHTSTINKSCLEKKKPLKPIPTYKETHSEHSDESSETESSRSFKFEPQISSLTISELPPLEGFEQPKAIFRAEPNVVTFWNYRINTTYEQTFKLRNISRILQGFIPRLLPKSTYFQVDLLPGSQLRLAPGMCAIFRVRFRTDLYEDTREQAVFKSHNGSETIVEFVNCRDPPQLIICVFKSHEHFLEKCLQIDDQTFQVHRNAVVNSTIDCGSALLGQPVALQLIFKNCGSTGKFFLVTEEDWYQSEVTNMADNLTMDFGAFKIYPTYFEIKKWEYLSMDLYFQPLEYGLQVQKLFLLCDNGTLEEIEVVGDGVMFDKTSIVVDEKNASSIRHKSLVSMSYDEDAEYVLNFGECVIFEKVYRIITVYNNSLLDIHFKWEFRDCECFTENTAGIKKLNENFLHISNKGDIFPKFSTTDFEICLNVLSNKTGLHGLVLILYVTDIPEMSLGENHTFSIIGGEDRPFDVPTDFNNLEVIIAEIEVLCSIIPFEINFHPSNIVYSGIYKNDYVLTHKIDVTTNCFTRLDCKWLPFKHENIYMEPTEFQIDSETSVTCVFEVHVTGTEPIKENLKLIVNDGMYKKIFPINIIIEKKLAEFVNKHINFGVLRFSSKPQIKCFTIRNKGQRPLIWEILEYFYNPFTRSFEEIDTKRHLTANRGVLQAEEVYKIWYKVYRRTIRVFPRWCSYLILCSSDPNAIALDVCLVTFQVHQAHVTINIKNSQYPMIGLNEKLYIGASTTFKLCLHNTSSLLSASFLFGFPIGSPFKISLIYKPRAGVIKPGKCTHVTLIAIPLEMGHIEKFLIPCFIGSTTEPQMLKLVGNIRTLKVRYYLPCNDGSNNYYAIPWPPDVSLYESNIEKFLFNEAANDVATEYRGNISEILQEFKDMASESSTSGDLLTTHVDSEKDSNYSPMPICPCTMNEEEAPPRNTALDDIAILPLEPLRNIFKEDTVFQAHVVELRRVPVRTPIKKNFYIENATPISAEFQIEIINFPSQNSELELTLLQKLEIEPRNLWEEGIQSDLGLSIKASPNIGILGKKRMICFELWVYANAWGTYMEEVVITLKDLMPFCFNLLVEVIGTCIEFPLALNSFKSLPIIRFGCFPYLSNSVERKLKIKNSASIPLSLRFEVFMRGYRKTCGCDLTHSLEHELNTLGFQKLENECIFEIQPRILEISAKSTEVLRITLHPSSFKTNLKVTSILALVLAHVQLDDYYKYRSNMYVRDLGNHWWTISIIGLDASIELPLLKLELIKGDTRIRTYANDIIDEQEVRFERVLLFKNSGKAPAKVYMHIAEPFRIVKLCTAQTDGVEGSSAATVLPGECVEVYIECVIDTEEVLHYSDMLYNEKTTTYQEIPNFAHQSITVDRSLNIHQEGVEKQNTILELIIYYPILKVSSDFIDFGVVFIGNTKKMLLTLKNPTGSHIPFTVIKSSFANYLTIVPNVGIVPKATGTTPTSIILSLFFVPSQCKIYQDTIRIYTNIPFYNFTVTILGTGSKNEKFYVEGT